MILYKINEHNFYSGITMEAPIDKLATARQRITVYAIPKGYTDQVPPESQIALSPKITNGVWVLSENYYGQTIWEDGKRIRCNYFGPLRQEHSIEPPLELQEEYAWEIFKKTRTELVSQITVTVDNMVFDGDEESQDRMARAITAALDDVETTPWRLATNTTGNVTRVQLRQALRAAMFAQRNVWFME